MTRRGKGDKRRDKKGSRPGDRERVAKPPRIAPASQAVAVNGWTLLFWTEFRERWVALLDAARAARSADPVAYHHAAEVKFFRTVRDLVFREIPANPDHPQFRQGKTLGPAHTHWRRAKFHRRFRLFFRFHTASRTIIYAWLNDEVTLRKAGSQTDVYAVFRRMLERGTPPYSWDALVAASKTLPTEAGAGLPDDDA